MLRQAAAMCCKTCGSHQKATATQNRLKLSGSRNLRQEGLLRIALLGGQVQCAFSTVLQVIENVRGGTLRALAVTSVARMGALPDVPTIGEFVPGYEADSWFGVVAPKGTPTDIVNELNDKINAIVTDSKMKVQLIGLGATPKSMTPTEFGKLIADYTEKWAKVIKLAGIKPE